MLITGIHSLRDTLKQSKLQLIGASDAYGQFAALTAVIEKRKTIILVPSHRDVTHWANFLSHHETLLSSENIATAILPFLSLWGADRFVNPTLTKRQRLRALSLLGDPKANFCLVTTVAGLAQATFDLDTLHQFSLSISVGDEFEQDDLIAKLEAAGYRHSTIVDEEGLYSVRGLILDIFPPNRLEPVRLEFMGDTIQSIRAFLVDDQKSKQALDSVVVGPATEVLVPTEKRKEVGQKLYEYLLSQENVGAADRDGMMDAFLNGARIQGLDVLGPIIRAQNRSTIDILSTDITLIAPTGLDACIGTYRQFADETKSAWRRDIESARITADPELHYQDPDTIRTSLLDRDHTIQMGTAQHLPTYEQATIQPVKSFEGVSSQISGPTRFDQWIQAIGSLVQLDQGSVIILASSPEQEERIITLLEHRDIPCLRDKNHFGDFLKGKPLAASIAIVAVGELTSWIYFEAEKTLVIPDQSLFGVIQKKPRAASSKLKNYLSSFKDLKVLDLVVHILHGIGRYRGMVTMTVSGITGDFLHLEYAGGDKIYLPVDKLNLLQRYSAGGDSDSQPHVDRLGGGLWDRRKAKVKQSIKDMADKLLKLQAERALAHIHTYSQPNDDYFKFESEFPFDETEDQLKAIREVNVDLESSKAMDRLICGDVGFGKTEVAIRAAYRAVQEGLQVLILVPTTILCYQHHRTFSDRLTRHGIRVAQLNRFVSSKLAKEVMEDTANGKIDVLVGTHKLLNQSLKVKRLGLLIVDEEQKFGVVHKEKLKELRAGADILTLTATPIPRTLHMAMLGLRDISIITTPPHNRLSVKTFISSFDETLIREAIENEIARGGQVFFVHNRVEDIQEMTAFVKSLVPKATVRFAHGQMKENELESTIIDFLEQKFNVMVCTTIIESGVDMPNVNTLIVNHADRFGLAQLYQMRGRVGRASLQAFAYFMTKNSEQLTDESRRRLDVLATHQELGAGFQIASHDLEIRGAGNLLGSEQSGHAAEVGLEMYTDLLAEAIAELRGQMPERPKVDTEIKLPITAVLTDKYIPGEGLRLQLYKSLFSADSIQEIDSLRSEALDRYGAMPEEAARLFMVARLKFILSKLGSTQITVNPPGGFFEIRFGSLQEKQIDKIIQEVRRKPQVYRLSPDYRLFVYWDQKVQNCSLKDASQNLLLTYLDECLKPIAVELEIM